MVICGPGYNGRVQNHCVYTVTHSVTGEEFRRVIVNGNIQ